jgi:hypothetical protein
MATVLAVVQEGVRSDAHAQFVQRLQAKRDELRRMNDE